MDTASTRIEQAVARLVQSYALGQTPDLRALAGECGSMAPLALLRLLVEDYPLRWKHGQAILVEDFLHSHAVTIPEEVRLDLVRQEIAQRKRDPSRFGEPLPAEYRERFPELDARALGVAFAIAMSLAADSVVTWLLRSSQPAPAAAPEPPPLAPGPMTLGDAYRITGLIGQGGSKIVYRGVQLSTRQPVAIKQPLPRLLQGTDDEIDYHQERFVREGRIQARLNHQNIPAVFTVTEGSPERPPLIVERLARGRDWSSVLRERPLPENLRVLLQVSRALAVAHDDGVIHCDLKPRNIMVSEAGDEVYVLDWELALHVGPPDPHHPAPHYTRSHDIRGTPGYLPPEMTQRESRVLSPATDVFLLGAMLYEILTHTTPYDTRDVRVNTWLAHDPTYAIPSPRLRLEEQGRPVNVPLELERIAMQALERNPSRRYRHAREFADAIHLYLDHLPLEARVLLTEATLDEIARDLLPLREQLPVLLEEYPGFQTRLLRVADEFAQVRRTWRMAVPPLNEPGEARSIYWRAVDGELVARMQLISLAHLFGQDRLFVRGQLLLFDDMPPQVGDRVAEVKQAVALMEQ